MHNLKKMSPKMAAISLASLVEKSLWYFSDFSGILSGCVKENSERITCIQ